MIAQDDTDESRLHGSVSDILSAGRAMGAGRTPRSHVGYQELIWMRTTDPVGPPPLLAGAMLQFET